MVQVVCLLLWGLTWPKTLSFVVPREEVQSWKILAADFEKSHPNIYINLVTKPDDTTDYTTDERKAIYTADFQNRVAQYDLVYMDIVWPLQFADNLQDLTPYIQRDGIDTSAFLESEVKVGEFDGQLYRLPMRADVAVLYYRQDLLEQEGRSRPRTLAELSKTVDALKPLTGYLWQGRRYEGLVTNFVEVMKGMGATWIDPDTDKVGLNTPSAIAAAETLQGLIGEGGISPNEVITYTEKDALEQFIQDKAAFLRGWPYFWVELESKLKEKIEIAPLFSFSSDPDSGVGCRGGWGFGIPKNSAHPKAAWEAIKYFTSDAAQKKFVLESGFLPSRSNLFQDPEILDKYPHMRWLSAYLEDSSTFRPSIKEYGPASEILQKALGDILSGQQPAKDAMDWAQAETEKLLKPLDQGG
ncbi:ABC transporter substrate-binding protein [Leptolyngbya ectocarpi]|uniref:ABC transporter substrate-binding protein n=1 Tax=Leptolyngbya ectocarpi TaxID=1202 RepID=UPI00187F12D9|nr:ABC transporter substrate-binding protein [Leptolyngbya ectocarpi]